MKGRGGVSREVRCDEARKLQQHSCPVQLASFGVTCVDRRVEIEDRVGVLRVSRERYIMWLLLQKYWNLVGWNIGIDVTSEVLQRRM